MLSTYERITKEQYVLTSSCISNSKIFIHSSISYSFCLVVSFLTSIVAMETQEEQKRKLYHLHIDLDEEYAPARKRGKNNNISIYDMQVLRYQGKKHIDIWSDGRLYPADPITKSVPPFSNCSSLLRYIGDGTNGFLGYAYNLASDRDVLKLENHLLKQERDSMSLTIEQQKQKISMLEKTIKDIRRKQTFLGPRLRSKKLRNIESLKRGSGGCSKRIKAVR